MNGNRYSPIRFAWPALVVTAVLAALAAGIRQPAAVHGAARRPVLVELFTSEGCSSCPPADALLARLDAQQPVPGAEVIALSEHVTYWDRLGWRDPYSLDAMTDRQHRYAARFGLDEVYTPQAVVNGSAEMVGSDEAAMARAVARAAAAGGNATLDDIQEAAWSGDSVHFRVTAQGAPADALVMAALAQDSAQSQVGRGENAGHTLRHVAVVRVIQQMGAGVADGRPLAVSLGGVSHTGPMRLVVFLADRGNGHVLAAAMRPLTAPELDPGRPAGALQATSSPGPAPR